MTAGRAHGLPRRRWLGAVGAAALVLALPPRAAHAADLPSLVAATRASVLPVGTYNALDNPRFAFRGSGFVVGDGSRIVTNFHVLPEATGAAPAAPATLAVLVARPGGGYDVRPARSVRVDREHDLALLQVDGPPLPALALADATLVREGTEVALMGFPVGGVFGYSPVTHRGIVSSVTAVALPALNARQLGDKLVSRLREGPFAVYQLDATAYPGNSGGPLLEAASGRVVGVVNMVFVKGTRESALTNPSGITYAIPVRFVRDLVEEK